MSERVSIGDLKPGMMIVQVTAQNGPVKIRKSGLVSSTDMINGLAEMGVLEVEIDPELTVEVEAPSIVKSQTQQLLEREQSRAGGLDQSMSEQFNRSLFLPSVQELPGFWRYYARQAMTGIAVGVAGLVLGFAAATHTLWLPQFAPAQPVAQTPQPANSQPVTTSPQSVASAQAVTQDFMDTQSASTVVQQPPVVTAEATGSQLQTTAAAPEQQVAAVTQPEETLADYELEGRVLNDGRAQRQEGNISPELLQRFERAINDLDNTPQEEPEETEVLSMSRSDVPKVHELPAWVLTQLPGLAFSAHMYASNSDERWVRVNGKRVGEGELVEDGLRVLRIEPQEVILEYRGQEFSMAALTDW